MTQTQCLLIFGSALLLLSLINDGYKKFILKKKENRNNSWLLIIFPMIYFIFLFDGRYLTFLAEYQREEYNIPRIEESMKLSYRSRFKEKWINSDTSEVQHASKIIQLGQSIEKETDFFINKIENKTLRIKSTFPLFSSKPKKEYVLLNGIIKDNSFFKSKNQISMLNENQKDSLLIEWKLR